MRYLVLLLLAGCTATGAEFTKPKHGAVVYRNDIAAGYYDVTGCKLYRGYYVTKPGELEASIWNEAGTSRITAKDGQYIRIDRNQWQQAAGLLGVGGYLITREPFNFTVVPESLALEELKGLRRDCV